MDAAIPNTGKGKSPDVKGSSAKGQQKHALNICDIDQSLWLVKVPAFIADKWATADHDDILGQLKITLKSTGPSKPPNKQLSVILNNNTGDTSNSVPSNYTLEEVTTLKGCDDNFIAFSSDKSNGDGEGYYMDGKVTKNLILKPQNNSEYRQLVRDRSLSKIVNRKQVQEADFSAIELAASQSNNVDFISAEKIELKRKLQLEKLSSGAKRSSVHSLANGASEVDLIKSRIFEAFDKNSKLQMKDIIIGCGDIHSLTKEKTIKDVLETYAKYISRGPFRQFWELKPEFKNNSMVDADTTHDAK